MHAMALVLLGTLIAPTEQILRDVNALHCGGNPASMVIWGDAVPLVVGPKGEVFAAAGAINRGRVVVLGHGSFVQNKHPDAAIFTANAVEWLANSRDKIRVYGLPDAALQQLQQRGVRVEQVTAKRAALDFADVDVLIGSPQAYAKDGRLADLRAWLKQGGGMLVTETAWGVLQLNPGLTIDTLAAQELLASGGIRFTGGAHSGYGPNGTYPIEHERRPLGNANEALRVLQAEQGNTALAAQVVARAFQQLPLDASLIEAARALRAQHGDTFDRLYAKLHEEKLTPKEHPLAFALLDLDARLASELSPTALTRHPSAAAFPGSVGEQSVDTTIALDPRIPGWRTTGLWVPPGQVVKVTVSPALAKRGLVAQVGAWQDPHDHAHRVRLRNALRRYPIESGVTEVASAIGGPLYIDLPVDLDPAPIQVRVTGAAPAPHYRHGVTDPAVWRAEIRHRQAPWAEFESDELVLTIPSSAIRDVEHPDQVMEHWDRVHRMMQSLEPRTDNHWADRQYRYVADVSVSWGYMYCPANAPIVIPVSEAGEMFRLENFDNEGPNELWGHYHEMGHAHQNKLWTDAATGEVTVNIFTVYALHAVNGYPIDAEVMRSQRAHAWKMFATQKASGRPYEEVGGPFPRLQYYALLWHEFGFEAFHEAFDRLRALPKSDHPADQNGERNLFVVHFSEVVARNLSDYAAAWGMDVTPETRQRLQALPVWMPTE